MQRLSHVTRSVDRATERSWRRGVCLQMRRLARSGFTVESLAFGAPGTPDVELNKRVHREPLASSPPGTPVPCAQETEDGCALGVDTRTHTKL